MIAPGVSSNSPHGSAKHGLSLVVLARPYFGLIVLATLLLAVFGLIFMLRMPSGIYPEVAFPRIVIVAQTPGLAVRTVEVAVTRPIEEAVGTVLGIRQVRSKTVRGASEVNIDFTAGTEMVQALNDIRAKIADINAQFPPGTSTLIERQTPSVFPIISFVVTGGRDPSALHDYAFYDLRPRISRIDDVSYGGDSPDRLGREKRYHLDRVHWPTPRRGFFAARGPEPCWPDSFPPHFDDQPSHDSGPVAAGFRLRPRCSDAATAGDRRDRRPDR